MIYHLAYDNDNTIIEQTAPTDLFFSENTLHLSELFFTAEDLQLKPYLSYLGFSKTKKQFYIKIDLHHDTWVLGCSHVCNTHFLFNLRNAIDLDKLIEHVGIKLLFEFNDNRLILKIAGFNMSSGIILYKCACLDDLFDDWFILGNPNIKYLIELLRKQQEHVICQQLIHYLTDGFLNPAREIVLTNKKNLHLLSDNLPQLIIKELFIYRGLGWH